MSPVLIETEKDITLKPLAMPTGETREGGYRQTKPTIVNGHFRRQAYGPQWSLRRIIFVGPYCKNGLDPSCARLIKTTHTEPQVVQTHEERFVPYGA